MSGKYQLVNEPENVLVGRYWPLLATNTSEDVKFDDYM